MDDVSEGFATPPIRPTQLRCITCGYDLTGAVVGGVCAECGTRVDHSIFAAQRPKKVCHFAVLSMVVGIASLGCWPAGVFALIFWALARQEIIEGGCNPGAPAMALSGLICGILGISFLLIYAAMMFIVSAGA